jgi:hypothetical protein
MDHFDLARLTQSWPFLRLPGHSSVVWLLGDRVGCCSDPNDVDFAEGPEEMSVSHLRNADPGAPNEPPGANSRHASRGRFESFGVAAVAQAER